MVTKRCGPATQHYSLSFPTPQAKIVPDAPVVPLLPRSVLLNLNGSILSHPIRPAKHAGQCHVRHFNPSTLLQLLQPRVLQHLSGRRPVLGVPSEHLADERGRLGLHPVPVGVGVENVLRNLFVVRVGRGVERMVSLHLMEGRDGMG